MKYFEWDEEKNAWLKKERGISFEEVVIAIAEGRMLGKAKNPNQKRYPGQKLYVIEMNDYAYVVPYIEDKTKIFLKTIYPSRKYTREYIEKGEI